MAGQTTIPEGMVKPIANGHRRRSFLVVKDFQNANQFPLVLQPQEQTFFLIKIPLEMPNAFAESFFVLRGSIGGHLKVNGIGVDFPKVIEV